MLEVQANQAQQHAALDAYYDFGRMMWVSTKAEAALEAQEQAKKKAQEQKTVKQPVTAKILPGVQPPKREKCALPIVHPDTGDELVVEKPVEVKKPAAATPPLMGSPVFSPQTFPGLFPLQPVLPPAAYQGSPIGMGSFDHEYEGDPNSPQEHGERRSSHKNRKGSGRGKGRGRDQRQDSKRGATQPHAYNRRGKPKNQDGTRYVLGTYTASMDGKFWCLSEWPNGERDENHRCQFGQHCLEVDEEGIVRPILVGGVGDYRVVLHFTNDDAAAELDYDGWTVATCGPDMNDLSLTDQAIVLGWTLDTSIAAGPVITPPKPKSGETSDAAEPSSGEKAEAAAEATTGEGKEEEKAEKEKK